MILQTVLYIYIKIYHTQALGCQEETGKGGIQQQFDYRQSNKYAIYKSTQHHYGLIQNILGSQRHNYIITSDDSNTIRLWDLRMQYQKNIENNYKKNNDIYNNTIQPLKIFNTHNNLSPSRICWYDDNCLSQYSWYNDCNKLYRWDLRILTKDNCNIKGIEEPSLSINTKFPIEYMIPLQIKFNYGKNNDIINRGNCNLILQKDYEKALVLSWGKPISIDTVYIVVPINEYLLYTFRSVWGTSCDSLQYLLNKNKNNKNNITNINFIALVQDLQKLYLQWEMATDKLNCKVIFEKYIFAIDGTICIDFGQKEFNDTLYDIYQLKKRSPILKLDIRTMDINENIINTQQWLIAQGLAIEIYREKIKLQKILNTATTTTTTINDDSESSDDINERDSKTALYDACVENAVWNWLQIERRLYLEPQDATANNDKRVREEAFLGQYEYIKNENLYKINKNMIQQRLKPHDEYCCQQRQTNKICAIKRLRNDLINYTYKELQNEWNKQIYNEIKYGSLLPILLIGLKNPIYIYILQSYINRTDEISVAAILVSHTINTPIKKFIQEYRMCLNIRQKWIERSEFDIQVKKLHNKQEKNIEYIWKCLTCKKNLRLQKDNDKSELNGCNICEYCGASQPRCAICYAIIGTGNDNSLLFCTLCEHGGHMDHISKWFADYNICPVPECNCVCYNIDTLVES